MCVSPELNSMIHFVSRGGRRRWLNGLPGRIIRDFSKNTRTLCIAFQKEIEVKELFFNFITFSP